MDIKFYGIPQGTALTLSASVGAITVTQPVAAWGGGNTGGGGGENTPGARMTISLRRAQQQVAPEGIAFFANVSGFDAQPQAAAPGAMPASGDVYDAEMHDITYVWDFGDPTAPTNAYERMLPEWRDNNVGYGPFPAHVFTAPGTYTILCGAYERSSGKQAFASIDVTVGDPDVFFSEAGTICIAPDGNFTGAPTSVSANRVTSIAAAYSRYNLMKFDGIPTRILLKSGQVHQIGEDTGWGGTNSVYISTWGGAARAIVERTNNQNGNDCSFIIYDSSLLTGAVLANIDYRDTWVASDPVTSGTFKPTSFMRVSSGHVCVYNCTASGVDGGFSVGTAQNCVTILSNCSVTGWRTIGFWVGGEQPQMGNPETPLTAYAAFVGCRATQDIQATQNGAASPTSVGFISNHLGPIRTSTIGYLHMDGLEFFARNGWSARSDGSPADQECFRDHRNDSRSKAYISRLFAEGGFRGAYWSSSGMGAPNHPCNTVMDKFYVLASANSTWGMALELSCVTIRNGIIHVPNVKNDPGVNPYNSPLSHGNSVSTQTAENRLYPLKIHNVTIVSEQSSANNPAAYNVLALQGAGYWNEGQVQAANNVLHRPNVSGGFTGDMPLDTTRLGIEPRNLGFKWYAFNGLPAKIPMDTSYATPANPMSFFRPLPGSPAIASATGALVAYDDLLGNVRPASASRGAIEPA